MHIPVMVRKEGTRYRGQLEWFPWLEATAKRKAQVYRHLRREFLAIFAVYAARQSLLPMVDGMGGTLPAKGTRRGHALVCPFKMDRVARRVQGQVGLGKVAYTYAPPLPVTQQHETLKIRLSSAGLRDDVLITSGDASG